MRFPVVGSEHVIVLYKAPSACTHCQPIDYIIKFNKLKKEQLIGEENINPQWWKMIRVTSKLLGQANLLRWSSPAECRLWSCCLPMACKGTSLTLWVRCFKLMIWIDNRFVFVQKAKSYQLVVNEPQINQRPHFSSQCKRKYTDTVNLNSDPLAPHGKTRRHKTSSDI